MVDERVERLDHDDDIVCIKDRFCRDQRFNNRFMLCCTRSAGVLSDLRYQTDCARTVGSFTAFLQTVQPRLSVCGIGHAEFGCAHGQQLNAGLLGCLFDQIEVKPLPAVCFDTVKAERTDFPDRVTEVHTSEETGNRYTNSHNHLP